MRRDIGLKEWRDLIGLTRAPSRAEYSSCQIHLTLWTGESEREGERERKVPTIVYSSYGLRITGRIRSILLASFMVTVRNRVVLKN